jgi:hypothetical protein
MAEPDAHGPIDVVVLEFPGSAAGAGTAQAIVDLVDRGTIRMYDLMVVRKDQDGRCAEIDLAGDSGGTFGAWSRLAGARSGLLGAEDVQLASDVLDADTAAAVLLYENAWAVPFVAAARSEGAELVASARLTAQQIMDALDAVEAAG